MLRSELAPLSRSGLRQAVLFEISGRPCLSHSRGTAFLLLCRLYKTGGEPEQSKVKLVKGSVETSAFTFLVLAQ